MSRKPRGLLNLLAWSAPTLMLNHTPIFFRPQEIGEARLWLQGAELIRRPECKEIEEQMQYFAEEVVPLLARACGGQRENQPPTVNLRPGGR